METKRSILDGSRALRRASRITVWRSRSTVYASYLAAVNTGSGHFDALPMAGTEQLVDPQAGIAFDLETYDASQIPFRHSTR